MATEKSKPTLKPRTPKPAHVEEAEGAINKAKLSATASDDRARRAARRMRSAATRLVLDAQAKQVSEDRQDDRLDPAAVAGITKQLAEKYNLPDRTASEYVVKAIDDLEVKRARDQLVSQEQATKELAAVAAKTAAPKVPTYEAVENQTAVRVREDRANWRTKRVP